MGAELTGFLGMLPRFKKLDALHYVNHAETAFTELFPLLYASLPLLESLEDIVLGLGSAEKIYFMKLLECLPPKLKSLSLSSSLKEEELQELIKDFFSKVPRGELRLRPLIIQADQKEALSQLQKRLQEFAEKLGISEERLSLNYHMPNSQ